MATVSKYKAKVQATSGKNIKFRLGWNNIANISVGIANQYQPKISKSFS